MTGLPTPAMVPAGHMVWIIVPHRTYVSAVMSPAEAKTEADRIADATSSIGGATGLIQFVTDKGRVVRIRARQITAIEYGPVPPHRDEPAAAAEPPTPPTPGAVPTPLALAGRGPRR